MNFFNSIARIFGLGSSIDTSPEAVSTAATHSGAADVSEKKAETPRPEAASSAPFQNLHSGDIYARAPWNEHLPPALEEGELPRNVRHFPPRKRSYTTPAAGLTLPEALLRGIYVRHADVAGGRWLTQSEDIALFFYTDVVTGKIGNVWILQSEAEKQGWEAR